MSQLQIMRTNASRAAQKGCIFFLFFVVFVHFWSFLENSPHTRDRITSSKRRWHFTVYHKQQAKESNIHINKCNDAIGLTVCECQLHINFHSGVLCYNKYMSFFLMHKYAQITFVQYIAPRKQAQSSDDSVKNIGRSVATLNQSPLLNCCCTFECAEQTSRCFQILVAGSI